MIFHASPGSVFKGVDTPDRAIPTLTTLLIALLAIEKKSEATRESLELRAVKKRRRECVKLLRSINNRARSATYYRSNDALGDIADLIDALDQFAPEGYFFNKQQGELGFWELRGWKAKPNAS